MHTDPLARLFACGGRLPLVVERGLLSRGEAVRGPLLEVLRDADYDEAGARGQGHARVHAARLLGCLGVREAIPDLARAVVQTKRLPVAIECLRAISRFGPEAVDPLFSLRVAEGAASRRLLVVLICSGVRDPRILAWLGATIQGDPWFGSLLAETYEDPAILPELESALDRLLSATTVGHRAIGTMEVLRKAIMTLGGEVDAHSGAVMERIAHDIRDGRVSPSGGSSPRPLWPELGLSQAGR
jgi:hypothetical protein